MNLEDSLLGSKDPSALNRTLTFSEAAIAATSTLTRTMTRTLTGAFGLLPANDAELSAEQLRDILRLQRKAPVGDVPLPGGFATERRFPILVFLSVGLGLIMGLIGLCYLNLTDEPPKYWTNNDEFSSTSSMEFYAGEKYWIIIPAGAGLLVGILRWLAEFPDNFDGLFKEINSYHVDYRRSPLAFALSVVSLAGGATLGPEAALGNVGGGLSTWVAQHSGVFDLDEDDKKIIILSGMAAAIGSLFPSPLLTVMMMFELGKPPRDLMESVTIMGIASLAAFMINYQLIGKTFLSYLSENLVVLSVTWEYENTHCFAAFVIGLLGAVLNLLIILLIGLAKTTFGRIRIRLEHNKFLACVVPPVLGGFFIGNGNLVLDKIVSAAYQKQVSVALLAASGFARCALLAISMNCGFVGGFIFPLITIGVICGSISYLQYSYLPIGLHLSCFIAALMAGMVPMPYTITCLVVFLFFLGAYQTSAVFVATLTSYCVISGSGLLASLQNRARERELAAAMPFPTSVHDFDSDLGEREREREKKEEVISIAKYVNMNNHIDG